jgi:hypothetical protein
MAVMADPRTVAATTHRPAADEKTSWPAGGEPAGLNAMAQSAG